MTSTASVIGNKFVLKYYTILSEKPESLWHFFKNLSQFTYGSEGDNLPDDTVVGAEGEAPRKFVQTFLLAVQEPAGYYVHNSVFRYLKETSSPFLPNPNQAQPPHQVQSQTNQETKAEKEPEVVQEKPAPAPVVEQVKPEEPKPAPPKVEEVKKEEIKKEETPVPAPVVEKKVEEKPVEPPKKPEQKEEKQASKPAPQSDEKAKGWAAIVTKTVASSKSEPQQLPVQTAPKPKVKETKEPAKEAPKEKETPKETPKEAKEAPKEAPKDANNHSEAKADKPEKERKASKNASSTSGFLPLEENHTVFVSNIPFQATEDQVRECFQKAGEVRSVVVRAKQGFCFVEFASAEVVQKALQLAKATQFMLDGRVLSLELKKPNIEGVKKDSKKDFKERKKPQSFKNNGKPKENNEKDNKPKKPYLKEGIISQ